LKVAKEPISLDLPLGPDSDATLVDSIEDTHHASPLQAAAQSQMRAAVKSVLDELPDIEAGILRMRFGIDLESEHTAEESALRSRSAAGGFESSKPRRCANCGCFIASSR